MQIPKLREWRERRGLTQKELAQAARVSPRSVAGYEAGQSIRPNTARKIADALEIAVEDLLNTAGEYELDRREKSRPKAQPLLWSDEPREQRPFNFREARENLEEYCEQWERLIAEGKLDETAVWWFFDSGCWIPMMDIALATELHELHRTTGLGGRELTKRSEIARANDRYLALSSKVFHAFKEMRPDIFDDPENPKTNVIRFEAARDRWANLPGQMFG